MTADNSDGPTIIEQPDVAATFRVMQQLRPRFTEAEYVATVRRLMNEGFRLAAVAEAGAVTAVAGYRFGENLAWGRYLYVDDLVSDEGGRSRGHGHLLLDWLKRQASLAGCRELHLDSGVQRHAAHRFYLRERMDIVSHHFKIDVS